MHTEVLSGKETAPAETENAGAGVPLPASGGTKEFGGYKGRLILSGIAAVAAFFIGQVAYRNAPVTGDENSYVFQAHLLLEGRVKHPAPDFRAWFDHPMIVLDRDAGWFSRYFPAHPLWLAPGVRLGQPRVMSALAAGLSTWLLTGVAALLGAPAVVTGVFLVLSPYFLFMHGTLLSHTSAMLSTALMLYAYVRWSQRRSVISAAVAGCAWSFLYLNRPYTAALVAVPFAVDALVMLWRRHDKRAWQGTAAFGGCAVIGLPLGLWYNLLTTGDLFVTPYAFYSPDNKLGFDAVHTPLVALEHLAANTALLDEWLMGFHGGLLVWIVLIWFGWQTRWSLLAITGILLVLCGHLLFNCPGVNMCGPFYYFESLPFFVMLAALAIRRLWALAANDRRWQSALRLWPLVLLILVVVAMRFMVAKGAFLRRHNAHLAQLSATARAAPPRSVVLVDNVFGQNALQLMFNPQGLASDPLIMPSLHDDNYYVAHCFPHHGLWLLDGYAPDRLAPWVAPTDPMERTIPLAHAHSYAGRLVQEGTEYMRAAEEGRDQAGYIAFGNYTPLYTGAFEVVYQLNCKGVSTNAPVVCDLSADKGKRVLASCATAGKDGPCRVVLPFTLEKYQDIEPRVYYGGSGCLVLRSIKLREQ